jgi:hypothetical protein
MEIHAATVVEIWEAVRDLIPAKQRGGAILSILEILVESDVEIDDMEELKGVDDDMDDAIVEVFGDDDEDEE